MGAVEEMMCVLMLQRGHSGYGCDLASTLCKYDLRKGDLFVLSRTSHSGKYLFRATNVWWKCAQYFVIAFCGKMPRDNRCMYMAHVCFMSVVVIGWGSVGIFVV